jgi:hypothetical protein
MGKDFCSDEEGTALDSISAVNCGEKTCGGWRLWIYNP